MWIPKNYEDKLNYYETELLIKFVKDNFERHLADELDLMRVSAPLFLKKNSGLNDDLNGIERPVAFDAKNVDDVLEVVHSLAKWKRYALKKYDYKGKGIYTDMNAIRRDEEVDNIHSYYVDQWDWERLIAKKDRNLDYFKKIVNKVVHALKLTENDLVTNYPKLERYIEEEVFFITTQELEDLYPALSPKQREDAIAREHHSVCILKIGDILKSGQRHDRRAPDYDDWTLNGDILIYYPLFDKAVEISSMGIRVDKDALLSQLQKTNQMQRLLLPFHPSLMKEELPLTIGGGIGQSRICLMLLNKAHIGEVQASIWPDETIRLALENGIHLL